MDIQKVRPKMSGDDKNLHQRFSHYGANAKLWMRKCVMLLPEIEKNFIWEKKGFRSIHEYAAKLAGMGRDTVNDALRILKRTEEMPELRKVIEQKGINAVRPVIAMATPETDGFWAQKAMAMSKNVLETYVKELYRQEFQEALRIIPAQFADTSNDIIQHEIYCTGTSENDQNALEKAISIIDLRGNQSAGNELRNADEKTSFPIKKTIGMELEQEVLGKLEKLKGEGSWNKFFKQLLKEREEQLEQEKPEAVQAKSRYIPAKIVNYVTKRTNGQCAFLDCKKPYVDIHHTERFSLKHVHDPDTLQILCKSHHMMAHHGLIDHEECGTGRWRILLEPDENAEKFHVDRIVQKYRTRAG